jgi:hypothetical protein
MAASTWTPPQYSKPAVTIITVPQVGNPVLVSAPVYNSSGLASAPVYTGGVPAIDYVFDAVLKASHKRVIKKTQHPVLTGANISDHFYNMPSRVVLEIGMSDAMSSFTDGIWVGASTKSISAWQILKGIQATGTPLTVTTRLDTYKNMLIESMDSPDTNRTSHALRATIVLEELISASVSSLSTSSTSTRPQTTDDSPQGLLVPTIPGYENQQQNVVPSSAYPDIVPCDVPGAGTVSSGNLGNCVPKGS